MTEEVKFVPGKRYKYEIDEPGYSGVYIEGTYVGMEVSTMHSYMGDAEEEMLKFADVSVAAFPESLWSEIND